MLSLTLVSSIAYIAGDSSKRLSKAAYGVGAILDTYALEILESTMNKFQSDVWKEILD